MKGLFIETPGFERLLQNYLGDDDYRGLQQGTGKRGGLRVIYYLYGAKSRFYMLTLYKKGEVSDLPSSEKKDLKRLVKVLENE